MKAHGGSSGHDVGVKRLDSREYPCNLHNSLSQHEGWEGMSTMNAEGKTLLDEEEFRRQKDRAKDRFNLWRMRALYANLGLFVSFAGVYPFIDGRPLSSREELAKQLLLLIALGMLFLALYVNLLLWGAWRIHADAQADRL